MVTMLNMRAAALRDSKNLRKWTDLMKTNTFLYLEENKLIQQDRLGTSCLRSSSVKKYWGPQ